MIRDAVFDKVLPLIGKALMNAVLQLALFMVMIAMFVSFVISL